MMGRFISLIAALVVFWLGTGFVTAEADDVPQAWTRKCTKAPLAVAVRIGWAICGPMLSL